MWKQNVQILYIINIASILHAARAVFVATPLGISESCESLDFENGSLFLPIIARHTIKHGQNNNFLEIRESGH